ncbi:MAG TPA: pilus (MSHA type) biogenesis protein MshL [Thiotrichales bacterium]|nr:pilus (MSHA type) biogenesis protein MshL [Thiotrichales bacterium]
MIAWIRKVASCLWPVLLLTACAQMDQRPGPGHLTVEDTAVETGGRSDDAGTPRLPPPALVPPPAPTAPEKVYTLVGSGVPVADALFSLARDAGLEIDIHPDVEGTVTINAIDRPLDDILRRIERQASVRIRREGDVLVVEADSPYLVTYRVDYVNLARVNASTVSVATQISTTGVPGQEGSGANAGDNNSTTRVTSRSVHDFWTRLERNIRAILGAPAGSEESTDSPDVVPNPEAGLLTVRATRAQHARISAYLDGLVRNMRRQVLIEATLVEVTLDDRHRLGVDWSLLANSSAGLDVTQSLLGLNLNDSPFTLLTYRDDDMGLGNIGTTIRMLREFGDVKVLSSPKIMALNNQTAMLKVVDNLVYFTIEADTTTGQTLSLTNFTSTVHTVPVGFVMSVTPAVDDDGQVTLTVRPTISRVTGYVKDPNPLLAQGNVESLVPEIQVREMESVLRVPSGKIAVLGGLIQDKVDRSRKGFPGLSDLPYVGDAFAYQDNQVRRTELVIFLRPRIVEHPEVDARLADLHRYLPEPRRVSGGER